jgi:hypothetical protein
LYSSFLSMPQWRHYIVLCGIAFLIRFAFFTCYIQHNERYKQPDSTDYHLGGWVLSKGYGLKNVDGRPLFWRTPGYPLFVSLFFNKDVLDPTFSKHTATHRAILLTQIVLCSSLPLLAGMLAMVLTHTPLVVWGTTLAATVHPGFILASTYLLTDGLAALFFIIFLICFFVVVRLPYEQHKQTQWRYVYWWLTGAALALSIYTWMRPMGQFVGLFAFIVLLVGAGSTWRSSALRAVWFMGLFVATLLPWFVRNYRWTHQIFFCPLFGLYLNVFNAPKILARTENISLKEAHTRMVKAADQLVRQEYMQYIRELRPTVICSENICFRSAWPVIKGYPGYFIYDWMTEVVKATFDLYSCQLTALTNNCFSWDPLVEYLPEKTYDCLYGKPMPWQFRLVAWIELFVQILLWVGIMAGVWLFIVQAFLLGDWQRIYRYGYLWIKCCCLIGVVVMQTGGFGYARLRLPIELLIIILGLMFWTWCLSSKDESQLC